MKFLAVFAVAVILAPAVFAQHQTFAVNPDASEVKMTLNTTHEVVNGTFHIQSGSIEFDCTAPKMSGSVVVLSGSGKTGDGSRDKKMNKEILQVEQHVGDNYIASSFAKPPVLYEWSLQAQRRYISVFEEMLRLTMEEASAQRCSPNPASQPATQMWTTTLRKRRSS